MITAGAILESNVIKRVLAETGRTSAAVARAG
jgi:hypothetical protein